MITPDLYQYFNDIIKADSNPFLLSSSQVFKQNGEVKTKFIREKIELTETKSIIDLIHNNKNIEEIDYYPKTFFKKIFNIKSKVDLGFESDDDYFVLMSKKTQKIFPTNCPVYHINVDDKIIIGKRSRLVYQISEDKLFINIDENNYKTIILK